MPNRTMLFSGILSLAVFTTCAVAGDKARTKPVRIGAVAYAPSSVTIFNGIKKYLNKNGFAADYVLYSNYDALVTALKKGEVDVAWNTPLAHARYHVGCGGKSQALVMRDVDRDFRAVVIARTDSDVKTAKDLAQCRFVVGSRESAEATVLPLYYLGKQGIRPGGGKSLCLDGEVDFKGNPCCSPRHVLAALKNNRGEAGIISERMWKSIDAKQSKAGKKEFRLVWKSPAFSHCVFTAAHDFDKSLGRRFTKLMLAMDPKDPATADVMRLEGTRKWLAGSQKGFQDLFRAVDTK